ncbi:hypothetical protein JRQ81_017910, partial [Phrynocephalus forsythii]
TMVSHITVSSFTSMTLEANLNVSREKSNTQQELSSPEEHLNSVIGMWLLCKQHLDFVTWSCEVLCKIHKAQENCVHGFSEAKAVEVNQAYFHLIVQISWGNMIQ